MNNNAMLLPADVRASKFAGFEILPDLVAALSQGAPKEISLDLETTGKTPWSAGKSAKAKIGNEPVKSYCARYDCDLDLRLRARVLTVSLPSDGIVAAIDLDRLTPDEIYRLVGGLSGHVWIGHNVGFDYQWLLSLNPDVRPARILDTMLMVTCLRPQAMYEMQDLFVRCYSGLSERKLNHLRELNERVLLRAQKKDMSGGALSLDDLALWLFDRKLSKEYQRPINWCPDYLSDAHYEYCVGDVDVPRLAVRRLLNLRDDAQLKDVFTAISNNSGRFAYESMETALHGFVRMQRKGLLWSKEKAAALMETLRREAEAAMSELKKIAPALAPHESRLLDPDVGVDDVLRAAIADAIRYETGRDLPKTSNGNATIDAAELRLAFPKSRVVAALQDVLKPVSEMARIPQYASFADEQGRIHPLTSISTATGRTTSSEPNLQNIPRDPRFRALFVAPPGHKIIATDFSSIELRIAAALGVRAFRVLKAMIRALDGDPSLQRRLEKPLTKTAWVFRAVPSLLPYLRNPNNAAPQDILAADPHPDPREHPSIEAWAYAAAHQLAVIVHKIWRLTGGDEFRLPFRAAYEKRLDPHLITAVAMEAQGGRFDLKGLPPIEYMLSLTTEEQAQLKKDMKGPRQAAKAVGFGLVYQMNAYSLWEYGIKGYGLDWSESDAVAAREAYFDLYPEIALWHWLIKYALVQYANILDPYRPTQMCYAQQRGEERRGKLYRWSTLSGRITVSSKITSGTNYQDQGTGAEIAFRAFANLPPDVQDMVVNFVHDEFVLEVPESRVAEVHEVLEKTMIAAADSLLMRYGIPTEVESAVGDCWIH